MHPYHHTFASSSGMHSQKQSMFNFMRHLQERSDSARQCRDAAFDNDTAHTCEPAVTVPADILRRYQHMRHAPANMHMLFVGAVPSVSADPMSPKEPLVAWRWKMLMIQMNLLSALNGICNELKGQKYTPHHIIVCDRACSEQTLQCQNFELKPRVANAVGWTRTPPSHEFQSRSFISLPTAGAHVPVQRTDNVNLLDCTYGIMQSIDRTWCKPVWRTASHGDERNQLRTSAVHHVTMDPLNMSSYIVSGPVQQGNDWYNLE